MKKQPPFLSRITSFLFLLVLGFFTFFAYQFYDKYVLQVKILKEMVARLEADSRVAEVVVTDVHEDSATQEMLTTIKFLEYGANGEALLPKFFTFSGNIIQFQSLVIRFDDVYIEKADTLRGKSAYLFWKAFMLKGDKTQEYTITSINEVPAGYKIDGPKTTFEREIWKKFWDYALNPKSGDSYGIKNAQIEAPGTKFLPGILYTLRIEHDGGLRIDAKPIPPILKGEKL